MTQSRENGEAASTTRFLHNSFIHVFSHHRCFLGFRIPEAKSIELTSKVLAIFYRPSFGLPWEFAFGCIFQSVGLQGVVKRVNPEAIFVLTSPLFQKSFPHWPVSQRPPPNRTDCGSQWRKFKSQRTVAVEIAWKTYLKTCYSEVHYVFDPVCVPFLVYRIKTLRTSCSSHEWNCESTSQDQFILVAWWCLCMFVHVCAGQELQEEIKKLEHEALEKGAAIKFPYLCKAEKSWNILVSQTWTCPLNPKISFYSNYTCAFWSRLFSCFAALLWGPGTSRGRGTREMWWPSWCLNACYVVIDMWLKFFKTRFKQENEFLIPISIAGPKVFTDTWDGSWDILISRYPCQWPQLGQVRVDLEDPAALAKFLVTANIKLIRAEWLSDALDVISGHTAAGRLNLRKLTFQAIKYQAVVFFWILCVARMTTPTMDRSPSLEYIWNLYTNLSCRFKFKSLKKGQSFIGIPIFPTSQTEEIPNHFTRVVATALWTRFLGFLERNI